MTEVTLTITNQVGLHARPAAAFYPARELNGDPTNWWGPNPAAVQGMLKVAGFSRVDHTYTWLAPVKPGEPAARGNAIFHAWK